MIKKEPIIETMRKRKSIRTFDAKNISVEHINIINDYISKEEHLIGPFGGKGRIELVLVNNNVSDKGIKLGTYGFIKNPRGYLVGICENKRTSLLDFGFVFQKLVLLLTKLEIGTCWMGGTFNRHSFKKEIQLWDGEFIPCITPIGYKNDKQRILEKALRFAAKSDNRKPWNNLFFNNSFQETLADTDAGSFEKPLEMVRLGPSASNKQPWRLVMSENREQVHFYIEHTPAYSTKLGYDMQLLDLGIAMCQFEMACMEQNIGGEWVDENPKLPFQNEHVEYVVSWRNA